MWKSACALVAFAFVTVGESRSEWVKIGDFEVSVSSYGVKATSEDAINNCSSGGLANFTSLGTNLTAYLNETTDNGTFWISYSSNEASKSDKYNHRCPVIEKHNQTTIRLAARTCNETAGYVCQRYANATWTEWSSWGDCSESCPSKQERTRHVVFYGGNRNESMIHYRSCPCSVNKNGSSAPHTSPTLEFSFTTITNAQTTRNLRTAPSRQEKTDEAETKHRRTTETSTAGPTPDPTTPANSSTTCNGAFNGWNFVAGGFFVGVLLVFIPLLAAAVKYYRLNRQMKEILVEMDYMKSGTVREKKSTPRLKSTDFNNCAMEEISISQSPGGVEKGERHYVNVAEESTDNPPQYSRYVGENSGEAAKPYYQNVVYCADDPAYEPVQRENTGHYITPANLPRSSRTQEAEYERVDTTNAAIQCEKGNEDYEYVIHYGGSLGSLHDILSDNANAKKPLNPVTDGSKPKPGATSDRELAKKTKVALKPIVKKHAIKSEMCQSQDTKKTNTALLPVIQAKPSPFKTADTNGNSIIDARKALKPVKKS